MPKKKLSASRPFPINKEAYKKLKAGKLVRLVFKNGVAYADPRYD